MTIKMPLQDSELHKFASQVIGMIVPKTSAEQSSTPQPFLLLSEVYSSGAYFTIQDSNSILKSFCSPVTVRALTCSYESV